MYVIGAGRIGQALALRAQEAGQPIELLDRQASRDVLLTSPGVPILVATRNDDMKAVVQSVPSHRRAELVFLQNGMIRPWLRQHHLGQVTRGLLYFAVPALGDRGEATRPSPLCGPYALPVAQWLSALGVPAWAVDWARFSYYEVEKLVWIAAMGLLGQRHGCTVGEVVDAHMDELAPLVDELRQVCRADMGVDVPQAYLLDNLVAYSREIPHFRNTVKELVWRNGWFLDTAARRGVDTPLHRQWMSEVLGSQG